jgi:hypothetical protein
MGNIIKVKNKIGKMPLRPALIGKNKIPAPTAVPKHVRIHPRLRFFTVILF